MIELRNIHKTYDNGVKTHVLKGVNLTIERGEFISIIGKSGSGKSTLLNILGLMDGYNEGSYIFNQQEMKQLSVANQSKIRNKTIGFVFQSFNLIDDMTALQNIEIPMGYAGISYKEMKRKAHELLSRVGLADKYKNYPYQLSGGEKQRTAIARALANNPSLILADEPTGNLDTQTSKEIIEVIKNLNADKTTVVLITHDMDIANLAHRTLKIKDGVVEE